MKIKAFFCIGILEFLNSLKRNNNAQSIINININCMKSPDVLKILKAIPELLVTIRSKKGNKVTEFGGKLVTIYFEKRSKNSSKENRIKYFN